MKGLYIVNPGASTTIQDTGRQGVLRHGLAAAGAMDLQAFYWANRLLDNPPGAACLEIMLGGFEAVAERDITIALTGADADITINGRTADHWQTLDLQAGDRLGIGFARTGRMLYLAMPAGVESPVWFGSQSGAPREQIDGLGPVAAKTGLAPRQPERRVQFCAVPNQFRPDYSRSLTLGLIPGYQYQQFTRDDLRRLTTHDYEITQESDRMGFRLNGPALNSPPTGIISEGITPGALQVPGDGQPIALMNDCQTIGGYPKPGVIAAVDRFRLAQRLPGQSIRFELRDLADAQNDLRLFELFFRRE